MQKLLMTFILILLLSHKCVLNELQYSDSFIAFYDGPVDEQNFNILKEHGYVLDTQINIGTGFYKFVRKEGRKRIATNKTNDQEELQRKDPKLLSFEQERLWFRDKKSNVKYKETRVKGRSKRAVAISDSSWSKQWHLAPSHTPSMGVYNVWDSEYTGKGVTVAIVDDGIETSHSDIAANYKASLSININLNTSDPSHLYSTEGHGTNCAGIVAAVKNTKCVIGTAYEASIPAIRLLDDFRGTTDSEEASALVHQLAHIDIYSNSWGPSDDGKDFNSNLSSVQQAALVQGVTNGRGGKGVIYTWAAGNGGANSDDCNVDGYANSMYTIAVTSLAPDSSAAWYTEECTSVMVATYGGDDRQSKTLATTNRNDTCIVGFQGTSAATPVASGIIALVLQANPALTWRDIQHMIVEYSIKTGLKNANFYTNGAGKKVSLSHGFGLMNAERMVNSASSWQTVPTRITCVGSTSSVTTSNEGIGNISETHSVGCNIKYLEHLLVKLSFKSLYREYTSIYLVSPNGTNSRLLRERRKDYGTSTVTWTFMSLHTWGENPAGTWALRMQSSDSRNKMYLYSWKLDLYGTETKPIPDTPADGSLGGYCDGSTPCISSTHLCNSTSHQCVSCDTGYHAINGVCIRDGSLGGYCNGSTPCILSTHLCNLTSNRCVSCDTGYNAINGVCIRDGSLGGYCDGNITCLSSSHVCNSTTNRCVSCDTGYHAINGSCIKDGVLGGYCNSDTACVDAGTGCERSSLTCVTCGVGYRVIKHFCEQDGTLGGFCDIITSCNSTAYSCENNICAAKTDEESTSLSNNNVGVIVGAVVGGLAGVGVVVVVVIVVIKTGIITTSTVAPAPAMSGTTARAQHPTQTGSIHQVFNPLRYQL